MYKDRMWKVSTLPAWAEGRLGDMLEAEPPSSFRTLKWKLLRFLYLWLGPFVRRWEAFVLKVEGKQQWVFSCHCGQRLELTLDVVEWDKQVASDEKRISAAGWIPDTFPEPPGTLRPFWYCSVRCLIEEITERLRSAQGRHRMHVEMNMEHLEAIDQELAEKVYAGMAERGEWPARLPRWTGPMAGGGG